MNRRLFFFIYCCFASFFPYFSFAVPNSSSEGYFLISKSRYSVDLDFGTDDELEDSELEDSDLDRSEFGGHKRLRYGLSIPENDKNEKIEKVVLTVFAGSRVLKYLNSNGNHQLRARFKKSGRCHRERYRKPEGKGFKQELNKGKLTYFGFFFEECFRKPMPEMKKMRVALCEDSIQYADSTISSVLLMPEISSRRAYAETSSDALFSGLTMEGIDRVYQSILLKREDDFRRGEPDKLHQWLQSQGDKMTAEEKQGYLRRQKERTSYFSGLLGERLESWHKVYRKINSEEDQSTIKICSGVIEPNEPSSVQVVMMIFLTRARVASLKTRKAEEPDYEKRKGLCSPTMPLLSEIREQKERAEQLKKSFWKEMSGRKLCKKGNKEAVDQFRLHHSGALLALEKHQLTDAKDYLDAIARGLRGIATRKKANKKAGAFMAGLGLLSLPSKHRTVKSSGGSGCKGGGGSGKRRKKRHGGLDMVKGVAFLSGAKAAAKYRKERDKKVKEAKRKARFK